MKKSIVSFMLAVSMFFLVTLMTSCTGKAVNPMTENSGTPAANQAPSVNIPVATTQTKSCSKSRDEEHHNDSTDDDDDDHHHHGGHLDGDGD